MRAIFAESEATLWRSAMKRLAAIVALVTTLTLAGAAPALALRHVQMGAECGTIVVYNATQRWSLRLFSDTFEGNYRFVFQGTGTIAIAGIRAGSYGYQFFAPNGNGRRSGSILLGC